MAVFIGYINYLISASGGLSLDAALSFFVEYNSLMSIEEHVQAANQNEATRIKEVVDDLQEDINKSTSDIVAMTNRIKDNFSVGTNQRGALVSLLEKYHLTYGTESKEVSHTAGYDAAISPVNASTSSSDTDFENQILSLSHIELRTLRDQIEILSNGFFSRDTKDNEENASNVQHRNSQP